MKGYKSVSRRQLEINSRQGEVKRALMLLYGNTLLFDLSYTNTFLSCLLCSIWNVSVYLNYYNKKTQSSIKTKLLNTRDFTEKVIINVEFIFLLQSQNLKNGPLNEAFLMECKTF